MKRLDVRTSKIIVAFSLLLALAISAWAAEKELEKKPADPYFAKFAPLKAPVPGTLLLQPNDRLAICGDSITEQKIYSRIMETYLTVCTPQLNVSVRQYGWSGETAEGFLRRMKNDCLQFQPTVATTCYGMNDYRYKPYDEATARWYREKYTAVVQAFQGAGVRVVLGSPGCVGKVASWVKSATGTLDEHNLCLCEFRNIGIEIAAEKKTRFADIFWPMYTAGFHARQTYGDAYAIAGKDGVHPGGAGHLLMAYAFLSAMGLDGNIGRFQVDLTKGAASASEGHHVDTFQGGLLTLTSGRYPFCAEGPADQDSSIRSGMTLVPFNAKLNRMILVATGGTAAKYKVTWGGRSKIYTADQLAAGVNLAEDFDVNPFNDAFKKVDAAVLAKQAFETTQVKKEFHGKNAAADMPNIVKKTEAERSALVAAIRAAFVPVKHTIQIEPQTAQ